jgi:hypothetical protein
MKLHTEFIVDKNGEHASLFVNGIKTNVWYFLPHYKHFQETGLCNHVEKRQKAETVKLLIDTGQLTGITDWTDWDCCRFVSFKIEQVIVVNDVDFDNQILGVTGYDNYLEPETQTKVCAELLGTIAHTQWIRRIKGNTVRSKIGIAFQRYGYSYGFID